MKFGKTLYAILAIGLLMSTSGCKKDEESPEENMPPMTQELFQVSEQPVFESPLGLAADPSILKSGDTLFLYYSAENFKIAVVYSIDDGVSWQFPNGLEDDDYAALSGRPEAWDATLETNEVLKVGNEFWMYYTGYREGEGDTPIISNYDIGLAISSNGIDFTRHPASLDEPILLRDTEDENSYDRHAMTSPGVVYDNGQFYMCYAGWNVSQDWTGPNAGIRLIGATSDDGINWTKIEEPIIRPEEVTYSPDVNEPSLLLGEDGYWYIPFSTGESIGIARSMAFEGPYEIYPGNIITANPTWATEVTAPDGFIEAGKLRLWYHGVAAPDYFPWLTGYASADFPLDWE